MFYSLSHNKRDIREEDLLDVAEELEKERCRLLIAMTELEGKRYEVLTGMTDNFVLWGRLVHRTKELIEEYKRRKWKV